MTKTTLLAGVSAAVFALAATAAFADGDFNQGENGNAIATAGATQETVGNGSLNDVTVTSGNLDGNKVSDTTAASFTNSVDVGTHNANSFSGGAVTGNVLNEVVANNVTNYDNSNNSLTFSGNQISAVASNFSGAISVVQDAASQSNVTSALTVTATPAR